MKVTVMQVLLHWSTSSLSIACIIYILAGIGRIHCFGGMAVHQCDVFVILNLAG